MRRQDSPVTHLEVEDDEITGIVDELLQLDATDFAVCSNRWVRSGVRRAFDIGVAAGILLALSPVFLAVAILIKATSRGPVFFLQSRVGARGRLFRVVKFRSMRQARRHSGVFATTENDHRITRVGRILRRYKLDEIPQLLNVLGGSMSLVGPRPLVPEQEPIVFDCRPGITSAASLAFHDQESLLGSLPDRLAGYVHDQILNPAKAAVDAEYMRTSGWKSDLNLLAMTALRVWCSSRRPVARVDRSDLATRVRRAVRQCSASHSLLSLGTALTSLERKRHLLQGSGSPGPKALVLPPRYI